MKDACAMLAAQNQHVHFAITIRSAEERECAGTIFFSQPTDAAQMRLELPVVPHYSPRVKKNAPFVAHVPGFGTLGYHNVG